MNLFSLALFLLVVPCPVLALPVSYKSTVTAKTYIPLIVISISFFFLLVAIKLVYMKHRRIETIHAPPTGSHVSFSTSSFGLQDKQSKYRHRGLLVGCLGSPTWETNLTSRLDRREQRRRSSFSYQRYTGSTMRSTRSASACTKSNNFSSSSRLTKSTVLTSCSIDADQFVLPLSSGHSWIPTAHSGSSSRLLGSCYGDFGESHGVRSPGGSIYKVTRRVSPCSIRLVDGPSHSNQVEYSFLSGLPPDAIVVSPLMGTRDSFQLSRCSLKCHRQAVPPLPPLPSFLPFHLPKDSEALESYSAKGGGYLPPLFFSLLISVVKVFHSQQQALKRKVTSNQTLDPDESKNNLGSRVPCTASRLASSKRHANMTTSDTPPLHVIRKTNLKMNHKRSQSYKGLTIEGLSPQTTLVANEVSLENSTCRDSSVGPLKSCLRQTII